MSEYFTYLDELINNISKYNLYFAIIRLAKIAIKDNIDTYRFYSDINAIRHIVRLDFGRYSAKLLDIDDGIQAYTDARIQQYGDYDIIQFMEGLN